MWAPCASTSWSQTTGPEVVRWPLWSQSGIFSWYRELGWGQTGTCGYTRGLVKRCGFDGQRNHLGDSCDGLCADEEEAAFLCLKANVEHRKETENWWLQRKTKNETALSPGGFPVLQETKVHTLSTLEFYEKSLNHGPNLKVIPKGWNFPNKQSFCNNVP